MTGPLSYEAEIATVTHGLHVEPYALTNAVQPGPAGAIPAGSTIGPTERPATKGKAMTYPNPNDSDQTQVIPDWRTDPRNRVDNGVDAPFYTNPNATGPASRQSGESPHINNGYTARDRAGDDRNHPVRNFFTTGDTKLSLASEAGRKLLPAINDGFAIASMWLGILGFTVVSIVLGIVSINQAKREGRRVSGMAVAGIIISIVEFVVFIFIMILIFAALAAATNSLNSGT